MFIWIILYNYIGIQYKVARARATINIILKTFTLCTSRSMCMYKVKTLKLESL